jgi:hypothetical protein
MGKGRIRLKDRRPYRLIHQLYRGHGEFRDPQAGVFRNEYLDFLRSRILIMGDSNAAVMMRDNVDIAEQARVREGYYRADGIHTVDQARKKDFLLRKPNPPRPWHPAGNFVTPAKCAILVCQTLPVQI